MTTEARGATEAPEPRLKAVSPNGQVSGYVAVEKVAEFLATTPSAIYSLVARREIPHRKLGRRLLFDLAEVRAWVDRQRVAVNAADTDFRA